MSNRLAFQTQLASIMEVLANAAVAEICKLVDDDYAVMSLQMSQCQRENKALKRKLHLLELRMARGYAERRIRESSLNRSSRVQVNASLPEKYRDYSRAPAGDMFPGRDELYGRQLNEDLWREREPSAPDVAIDRPVPKENETVAVDAGMTGPEAVLVKAETTEEGHKQQELFIREDGVAEAVSEGGETGYGAAQLEKADGHHSRTRRQALELQKTEDEEPDVLFIKEEHTEQERRDSQTHGGMSVQDGFVESSTDICGSRVSSSPAQITIALGAEESEELDSSLMKEPPAEQEKKTNQSAGVQITIQNVVGAQTSASLHSRDPVLPHRGGPAAAAAQIGVKVWDLPSTESQLQGGGESISNPLSSQSTQRRKMPMSVDVLGANNTLYERPAEVEALFTRWTANNSSPSQPSCSYVVDEDQDQDCVLVQPGALSVRGIQEGMDGVSSNRLQDTRGPLGVEAEWTSAAISQQTQQLSHYSRTEGVRLEASNRANVSQSIPKVTMNSQMLTNFTQPGFTLAGIQFPKRMEKGKRKSYICKYCGKAFTGLSNVEAHQRVHTGEKPFKCETCGKLFAEAGNLKKHQRVHTGEKPFTCTRCGKRFAWICNLRTHQQSASCGGV